METQPVTTARSRRSLAVFALVGLAAGFAAGPAAAQKPPNELIPLVGYQWGGTLNYTSGDVHANAAMNYGGILSVPVKPGYSLELSYTYQSTDLIARPNVGKTFKLLDLGTHYMQLSGRRDLAPPGQKTTPFVLGGLGATVFSPSSSSFGTFNTQWLFSLNAGAGVNVAMNEKVGLRLQARLLLPINWVSGGVYFGSGGGGATISGGSAICQGDATLGIVLKLGK
jgi:opacity protein-like surface antigen